MLKKKTSPNGEVSVYGQLSSLQAGTVDNNCTIFEFNVELIVHYVIFARKLPFLIFLLVEHICKGIL